MLNKLVWLFSRRSVGEEDGKYCKTCGTPTQAEPDITEYDEDTGEPVFGEPRIFCPRGGYLTSKRKHPIDYMGW